jgi:DUF917 family protein
MLTLPEQEALLLGCHILGTGGGGSLERGVALVRANAAAGRELHLASLDEVPDEALVAVPYGVGSLTPAQREQTTDPEALAPVKAFRLLQRYLGESFFGVLSTELGGGNTATALVTASVMGLPLVDADPAGRSVPEVFQTTFYLAGVGIAPMALVTPQGDEIVIARVADDFRAEALARHIAIASGSTAGVADHPLRGWELRTSVIKGAISHALVLGQAVARARTEGADAVAAATHVGKGYRLFDGVVAADAAWAEAAGFTVGGVDLDGRGPWSGKRMRIEFKNENMTAAIDGTIVATIPDLICILEAADGQPVTNPRIPAGLAVSVAGFPAPAEWRTPRGIESFGPPYLGLDIPYVPLEQLHRA